MLQSWSTLGVAYPLLVVVLGIRVVVDALGTASLSPDWMTALPLLQSLPIVLASWPAHQTAPEVVSPPVTVRRYSITVNAFITHTP